MKTQMTGANGGHRKKRLSEGGTRIGFLLLVAFIVGLICGGYALYRYSNRQMVETTTVRVQTLSDATLAVLQRLDAPVELRFYAPSVRDALPEPTAVFAVRVQQLLSEYQRAGGDKVRLIVSDPTANATTKAAAGDEGLLPFSDNNGGVFYLGITIAQSGRKETIAQLSPEWEGALEYDLSRAISRVAASTATAIAPAAALSAVNAPVDASLNEELLRTIPDLQNQSFDDAAKILREASLAEFTAAVQEMQSKVQEAQTQLATARQASSETDQQAAMKQLQQVQSEQTEKLKQITAQLQARIAALERLKGVSRSVRR